MRGGSGNQIAIRILSLSLFLLGTAAWGQASIGTIVFARGEANVEPVDPGDTFPAGISTIYAFIEFKNLTATDVVSSVWYQGDTTLLAQATTLSELLGATGQVPTGKIFFSLVFEEGGVPAVYRLEVSLNSQLLQTREFTIEETVAEEDGLGAGPPAAATALQPADPAPGEAAPPGAGEAAPLPEAAAAAVEPVEQPVAQPVEQSAEQSAEQPAERPAAVEDDAATVAAGFEVPGIAAQVVAGQSISMLHHYPETLDDPQLVFSYSDVESGTPWGWRLSREGSVLAEQMNLPWERQGAGLHVQPLGVVLDEGVYDIDLYLSGVRTASSSVTVGEPVPGPERLLFADDFDDASSGWGTATGPNGTIEYRDGRLEFTLSGSNAPAVSTFGGRFGDAVAEVEATTIGGPLDNALGIVARYQDNGNYYAFLVSADGYYSILHFLDGQAVWDQQWEFAGLTGIQTGVSSNRLRVLAQGPMLRFYVNGQLRGVIEDPLWQEGQMGVFAGVFEESGVRVGFDEWRVWDLPER